MQVLNNGYSAFGIGGTLYRSEKNNSTASTDFIKSLQSNQTSGGATWTESENEVLETIKSMISTVSNCTLNIEDGMYDNSANGFLPRPSGGPNSTIAKLGLVKAPNAFFTGFSWKYSETGSCQQHFTLSKSVIEKMAKDEDYKKEMLAIISEQVSQAKTQAAAPNPMELFNAQNNFGTLTRVNRNI